MAVLAHYLNGDFIPWYLTCCQATSCYIQLFWVAEGNFRIQFRLSLKAVGIAAYTIFTWKHTQHSGFLLLNKKQHNNPFKSLCYKEALLTPLLSSLSQLATVLITRGKHGLQNELLGRSSESITNAKLPCMFFLLLALLLGLVLENSQQQTGKTTFRLFLTDQPEGCASKTELVASLY